MQASALKSVSFSSFEYLSCLGSVHFGCWLLVVGCIPALLFNVRFPCSLIVCTTLLLADLSVQRFMLLPLIKFMIQAWLAIAVVSSVGKPMQDQSIP